jgi:mono/diheme cytochrome c family protein
MRVQTSTTVAFSAGVFRACLLLLVVTLSNLGETQNVKSIGKGEIRPNERQNVESRGQYIVEDLAICGQCHTPRDSSGAPDRAKWLQAAPVWLKSAEPVENWPWQAPRIAGAPPGTDAEMVTLLTTGVWRTGTHLRPPMPQFRMSRQDAEAVVAYLKTVKPASEIPS